ncbi:MAG: 4-hydroxythreonine-4-phosphate dehydrogenase PdxA [Spirochaetaceae bacterium]|jgi:4-hydroxythreonine-4-phosphate dehydrogenase|nr:4-hydroxythreonine-4-phosphate dehydrogenase PdxA [Spirochaetaceae bacterium]
MKRPLIAVTAGDPAGVGPEILAKAFASRDVAGAARCVAVGDYAVMENALALTGLPLKVRPLRTIEDGDFTEGALNLVPVNTIDMAAFRHGEVSAMCGKAAFACIEKSIGLALNKEVDAVATAPINKESLKRGGIPYIGHTEIFAGLTGTKDPLTVFEVRGMRIFFLSRHVSLRKACGLVRKDRIVDYVKRAFAVLRQFGVGDGIMAIAGLNPHSGEHGLFGDEEASEVSPAVDALKSQGYRVEGPVSADSVFHQALQGKYAAVLSLYHDQGHIAAKTLDFERTISITGGMPILRTSVDHGTAFDIAGKNSASAVSMIEAIILAAKYAPLFNRQQNSVK